jgi:alanine racemase
MATGTLTIDLDALAANWRALDALSAPDVETAAVVKADGYGLGAQNVARALLRTGARRFFVAVAEEGAALREVVGPERDIFVLGGHMPGDTDMIGDLGLIPVLNSIDQIPRHVEALPVAPFAVQLDTGMNRLGLEPAEWEAAAALVLEAGPVLLMSHLASADTPESPQNAAQLEVFRRLTDGTGVPRSLAATGGTLMGPDYHFEMTRPGIGLYGGLPHADARPVVRLALPVIQDRLVRAGESVGYGATWTAQADTRVATVAAGYADGLSRALSGRGTLWAGDIPCPILGRVSMDLIGCDVTAVDELPDALDMLGPMQGVDALAEDAGTIGYEMLTSLGARYRRRYSAGFEAPDGIETGGEAGGAVGAGAGPA